MRKLILSSHADITEIISYGIPAYKLNGHILYDIDLQGFKRSKGSIQVQYCEEIPYDLIKRIVEYRVNENLKRFN